MSRDPWTDRDPQRGGFDADLTGLDPHRVEEREGDPAARIVVLVKVEGENAQRLQTLAASRGQSAAAVVAALLQDAEPPSA